MRWAAYVWVWFASSCYSPTYKDCTIPCTQDCPSGFHCVGDRCRPMAEGELCPTADATAPPDGLDPAGDFDSDGVANGVDNCPTIANTDQANEDGDKFGDVCDPCPPFGGDADNFDTDGDNVGDGCDPYPNAPGDHIAVFAAFNHDPTLDGATNVSAGWTFDGNANVTLSGSVVANIAWLQIAPYETVTTSLTIDPGATFPTYGGTGPIDDLELGSTPEGIACWLGIDSTSMHDLALIDTGASGGAGGPITNSTLVHEAFTQGTTAILTESKKLATFACATNAPSPKSTSGSSSFVPTTPHVGLRARGISSHFAWLMIVTTPSP